jgi:hypothetical protein
MTRPISLKPYDSDKRYIKNELNAQAVFLVWLENDEDPEFLSVMADFRVADKSVRFVHTEKYPLREDWAERTVSNLMRERERA